MGLIKAAMGAVSGTLADQWKDFFSCESMDEDVLVVKGSKRVSGRSSNRRGEDNVISDGSGILVADGQCMMIVEQGRVVELSAEPGVYTYDSKLTPSVFTGDLLEGLQGAARDAWERFKFGGGAGKDQRIYYFNTKEIMGNKYGTVNPVPFKVIIDRELGKSLGISVRCNGEYSYKIVNPMLFYTNVCGNVEQEYTREEIDSQLKSELLTALQPAFAKISAKGVDYSEIPMHTTDIADALNDILSSQWTEKRGLKVVAFGVNSVSVSDEDKQKIQRMQEAFIMTDPLMAAGNIASAQADAMRMAASNENGAMMGFMGMGMAAQSGGMNTNELYAQGMQQQAAAQQAQMRTQQQAQAKSAAASQAPAAGSWKCSCGNTAAGKFCPECGRPKPADPEGWTCTCGTVNKGKFCMECGAKKPEGAPLYRCDRCGWEPEDPHHPPKFCPECGDVFDDNDIR